MTNQEEIQTMSTEKLAKYLFFTANENCDYCPAQEDCNVANPVYECCICALEKWLRMEADDETSE